MGHVCTGRAGPGAEPETGLAPWRAWLCPGGSNLPCTRASPGESSGTSHTSTCLFCLGQNPVPNTRRVVWVVSRICRLSAKFAKDPSRKSCPSLLRLRCRGPSTDECTHWARGSDVQGPISEQNICTLACLGERCVAGWLKDTGGCVRASRGPGHVARDKIGRGERRG